VDQPADLTIEIARPAFGPNPSLARIARGPVSMHLPVDSAADLPDDDVLHAMLDQVAAREASR
jgi:hypothetical protein